MEDQVVTFINPKATAFQVASNNRPLLVFRVEDDKLIAEYDPADLNEAAIMFVNEIRRIWNG